MRLLHNACPLFGNGAKSLDQVILKKGRAKPVLRRHPWIFSGAVERIVGHPADGDLVQVRDAGGNFAAYGLLNRHSQIVVRLLSWEQDEVPDAAFWRRRLERALAGRAALAADPTTDAYRLVHAEADGLPGLIVDRYSDHLVVQFLVLGMDQRKEEIADLLIELATPRGILERSDVPVRAKEGLPSTTGLLRGIASPNRLEVLENGHRFLVDLGGGQKTGFYLDQRVNRGRVSAYCAGQNVLDVFCYSGGFSVYAAAAGTADLTLLDSSTNALALAQENLRLNGRDRNDDQFLAADAFQQLRRFRETGRTFDVVILDPPKFAHTQADVQPASRGYKDINLSALQLLRPGGILATFSCSGLVSADLFQKIVFGAAVDAGREAQIIGRLVQGADHPVALTFPEGAYLKGLICGWRTGDDSIYGVLTMLTSLLAYSPFLAIALMTGGVKRIPVLVDVVPHLETRPSVRAAILAQLGDFDFTAAFAEPAKPALFVYGDHYPVTPDARAWREQIASAKGTTQLVTIPDAGQLPFRENAKVWRSKVEAFLKR